MRSSIGFDRYLKALRAVSGLYGTDCHVWCYADHHFRYYQIRGGEDAFKVGMKCNSEIDMTEFDFGRARVEERFQKLRTTSKAEKISA